MHNNAGGCFYLWNVPNIKIDGPVQWALKWIWFCYNKKKSPHWNLGMEQACLAQEQLKFYLDGATIEKIWKHHFFRNISNSCCWVTWIDLKPTRKFFFENISTNTAAKSIQNFGIRGCCYYTKILNASRVGVCWDIFKKDFLGRF